MEGHEEHGEWATRIRFVFGEVVRGIDHDEAEVLLGWVGTLRTHGARDLERELREHLEADTGPGELRLDADRLATLCQALESPDIEVPGLKLLQATFCAERAEDTTPAG